MKILVYDGDCPFCRDASARLVRWGWIREQERIPFLELPPPLRAVAEAAGADGALVVIDEATGEARRAARGLLWLLADTRLRFLARTLSCPPLLALLETGYRFVARNRYSLFPPRRPRVACSCSDVQYGARHVSSPFDDTVPGAVPERR